MSFFDDISLDDPNSSDVNLAFKKSLDIYKESVEETERREAKCSDADKGTKSENKSVPAKKERKEKTRKSVSSGDAFASGFNADKFIDSLSAIDNFSDNGRLMVCLSSEEKVLMRKIGQALNVSMSVLAKQLMMTNAYSLYNHLVKLQKIDV